MDPKIDKFSKMISRQRRAPKLWDYSYLMLRSNTAAFLVFRNLVNAEKKTAILDVGCGFKPWAELFDAEVVQYTGVDFDKELSAADFVAPTDSLPFSENSFDCLIYSEVLEHVNDLPATLKEMRRVAKNGTLVYISAPFVFPLHGVPHDYQRLSRYFYENIFRNDELILLKDSNSSLSTPFISCNMVLETTPFCRFRLKYLAYIFNNVMGLVLDGLVKLIALGAGNKVGEQFYHLPVGYAAVIRIKKEERTADER